MECQTKKEEEWSGMEDIQEKEERKEYDSNNKRNKIRSRVLK
jgi:hypothetical protein